VAGDPRRKRGGVARGADRDTLPRRISRANGCPEAEQPSIIALDVLGVDTSTVHLDDAHLRDDCVPICIARTAAGGGVLSWRLGAVANSDARDRRRREARQHCVGRPRNVAGRGGNER
jgi:hypothetical protein